MVRIRMVSAGGLPVVTHARRLWLVHEFHVLYCGQYYCEKCPTFVCRTGNLNSLVAAQPFVSGLNFDGFFLVFFFSIIRSLLYILRMFSTTEQRKTVR